MGWKWKQHLAIFKKKKTLIEKGSTGISLNRIKVTIKTFQSSLMHPGVSSVFWQITSECASCYDCAPTERHVKVSGNMLTTQVDGAKMDNVLV